MLRGTLGTRHSWGAWFLCSPSLSAWSTATFFWMVGVRNLLGDNISTTTNETSSRSAPPTGGGAAVRISRVTCQRSSSTTPVGVRGTAHSSEARQAHPCAFPRLRNLKLPYRGSALPLGKCGGGMSGYQASSESAESEKVLKCSMAGLF